MERVIVSVECDNKVPTDLSLPAEISAGRLTALIAGAMQWQHAIAYHITAVPAGDMQGRVLYPNETLMGAGIWTGSHLRLHPAGLLPESKPDTQAPPKVSESWSYQIPVSTNGPVTGFRDLGLEFLDDTQETEATEADTTARRPSGYVWKKLD